MFGKSNNGIFTGRTGMMHKTKIVGTGSFVPKKVLTNADLSKFLDTTDEWIRTRTGIEERHILAEGETGLDMAYEASLRVLEASKRSALQLNMIIMATSSPNQRLPGNSFLLQDRLGAKHASVFDVSVACSGFLYGISIADQFIKTGHDRTILVVGQEAMSKVVDWTDRSTCVLFGDAAGAVILEPALPQDEHQILLSTHLFANGSWAALLEAPGGGTAQAWTPESLKRGDHLVKMKGKEVFREAVDCMTQACLEALGKAKITVQDIDVFIPHQANDRIVKAIAKRLRCPDEKIFVNLNKYGNTSAASIPLALDEAVRSKKIKTGDLVLMATFGAGFAWGSALIRW